MANFLNLKHGQINKKQQFQELTFIGNTAENSVTFDTKLLNLSPDSRTLDRAAVEESLLIAEVHAARDISHQLKNFKIEPGATVKLVSKTNNGSVVISLGNKLIGIGAEIASKIVTTTA